MASVLKKGNFGIETDIHREKMMWKDSEEDNLQAKEKCLQ